ncbi:sialidase family protein [Pedobacter arcticus]|uniref:sialidase family protein n=1 Tax=Pedobacter arcticus TaxID=752140 RepID=UPI0003183FBB|nr:sialidase family protein [Pedobacter arcticus]
MKLNFTVFVKPNFLFLPLLLVFNYNSTAQVNGVQLDKNRANAAIILEKPYTDIRVLNRQHELVSSIATSEDGKVIYLAWYTGGPGEGPGNYVTLSVSTDGGHSWKNDELVVYPKDTTSRFFDPVLWRDKFGKVWLFYAVSMNNMHFDLRDGVNAIPVAWDGKKIAWEKPKLLSYGVMMNKPVYVPQIDEVLFPVSIWQLGKNFTKEPNYIPDGTFIYNYSYKKGKKLGYLNEHSSINTLPNKLRTFDEHQLVQINNAGDFLCLVRTKKGVYFSKSKDYGKSWTVLQPFTTTGPTTASRFYVGKLRSGNLLLILNDNEKRTNMTAFISKDGGETWPYKLLLDNRENVSYPDADEDSNGKIHITFDRDRKGAKEINYCSVTEQDIIDGNAKAVFKTRVNK